MNRPLAPKAAKLMQAMETAASAPIPLRFGQDVPVFSDAVAWDSRSPALDALKQEVSALRLFRARLEGYCVSLEGPIYPETPTCREPSPAPGLSLSPNQDARDCRPSRHLIEGGERAEAKDRRARLDQSEVAP